jgi:hypothetical protein
LGDAGEGLGVADLLVGSAIQVLERIEGESAEVPRDAGRVSQIQDRITFAAALDALIDAGEEARSPG